MENEYYKPIDYELLDQKTAYKGKRITVEELQQNKLYIGNTYSLDTQQ